jgi:hypothetical protein
MVTIVPMSAQVHGTAVLIHVRQNFLAHPAEGQNIMVAKVAVCSNPTRAYVARAGSFHSLT